MDPSLEVSGTRIRKQVERLSLTKKVPMENPERRQIERIPGNGVRLSSVRNIHQQLQAATPSQLAPLHRILFKRKGGANEIKRNIKMFSGFCFRKTDHEFEVRRQSLSK